MGDGTEALEASNSEPASDDSNSSHGRLRESRTGSLIAGTYRVLARIASGSMGDVYEAEHVRLGSAVAVKFLRASALADPRAVSRFRREARAVAALQSDHIVSVFDCGELPDGTPYLAMERLVGEDLRALLAREGRLPIRRGVKLVIEACRGLAVVHAAGLVHRDLKPANLFVVERADRTEHTKILDFGVAKALASEATHPGSLLGTVRYMAPEQLEDSAAATAAADIHALGAILYECLTGVPARRGEALPEIMFDIVHRDPKPPGEIVALPAELEAAVQKALSRRPGARHATVEELAAALAPFGAVDRAARAVAGPDEATLAESGLAPPASRAVPRAKAARSGGIAAVAATLALGAALGWVGRGGVMPAAEASRPRAAQPERTERSAAPPAAAPASAPVRAESTPPAASPPPLPRPPVASIMKRVRRDTPAASPSAGRRDPIDDRFDPTNPYSE